MAEQTPLRDVESRATFMEQAGWEVPAHFGDVTGEYRQAKDGAALFDLSHRGKVEVAGADAGSFLHNLSTNNIKDLAVGAGCEAFFATATAKAVDHARIYHVLLHDGRDGFWLDLEPGRNEALIKHLDRYLISEQAEFADRTSAFAHIHLAGPQAKPVLERALLDEVPDLGALQHMVRTFGANQHCHIRRHEPLALPGYDLVCLREFAPTIWGMLFRAGAQAAGLEAYETLRVEAGTPAYGQDIDENRFVAEIGRIAQAISYQKGCYLGQEPIVMARDRGQVQRTLLGLKLTGSSASPRGSKIFNGDKEVGITCSSVVSPALGHAIALAYLKRGSQEPGTKLVIDAAGTRMDAEVSALPFPGTR